MGANLGALLAFRSIEVVLEYQRLGDLVGHIVLIGFNFSAIACAYPFGVGGGCIHA